MCRRDNYQESGFGSIGRFKFPFLSHHLGPELENRKLRGLLVTHPADNNSHHCRSRGDDYRTTQTCVFSKAKYDGKSHWHSMADFIVEKRLGWQEFLRERKELFLLRRQLM